MSGRTGYPPKPSPAQVDYLCDLLLVNGADHDEIRRVRQWIATGPPNPGSRHSRPTPRDVSLWIDQLDDPNVLVAGRAGVDICQKADSFHYSRKAKNASV